MPALGPRVNSLQHPMSRTLSAPTFHPSGSPPLPLGFFLRLGFSPPGIPPAYLRPIALTRVDPAQLRHHEPESPFHCRGGRRRLRDGQGVNSKVVMVNDVSRAFLEAPAMRQVCVELPDEDLTEADRRLDNVGHLHMSLYGTRDAAMNW